jgi:hypothetical protein
VPAPTRWSLSPTDAAFVAALRYLPAAFFGGYVLLGTVAALSLVPALLANPVALAAVVLFALVGGPLSLLYLWPMLRDPDQRPAPDEGAWFADLKPTRIVAAALTGSVLVAATFVLFGRVAQLVLIVVCLLVPLVVVSFFRGEGAVDPGAGTLTYRGHTVDASLLRRVRTLRLGPVRLVVLRYHARVGGGWKPRVFLVPERVGADVEAVLRDGVVATPERDARTPDRAAQGLLVVVGAAFVLTGVAIATLGGVPLGIRGYVGAVAAALGALFVLGAYYIA